MECTECKNEFRIKSLEEKAEHNSKQHKEFYTKLEDNGKDQVRLEENIKQILDAVREIKNDLIDIKNKPTKRWELLIGAIITATATAIITLIVTHNF